METHLADFILGTPQGNEAEAILRKCVHCGFCTATCPTYQLLGDELDGPRGRIYLIKQVLEGSAATEKTQLHLDRCLTCRNCETTCPSGVRYGRLVEIGREVVERQVGGKRPLGQRLARLALREGLTRRWLFDPAMALGRSVRPLLPKVLKNKLPVARAVGNVTRGKHSRKMILLDGCVQPAMAPSINAATTRVLDAFGIELIVAGKAGCCGALRQHLEDLPGAHNDMRRNIDAWIPYLDAGVESIVINASGCALQIKEYGELLKHDPVYAGPAERISRAARDLSEILRDERMLPTRDPKTALGAVQPKVVFHPPCTLQHGQKIQGVVEKVLGDWGVDVVLCADSHLCCGSAGTYSVLQPALAYQLRDNKVRALNATGAPIIASANIGCLTHLESGTTTPVRHWIEVIDAVLSARGAAI